MNTYLNFLHTTVAFDVADDAAAVFAVLRRVPLPRGLSGMLEAESGFNDAPVVILVTAFAVQSAAGESVSWWSLALTVTIELVVGSLVGLGVGWLGGRLMSRVAGARTGERLACIAGSLVFLRRSPYNYLVVSKLRLVAHRGSQDGRARRAGAARAPVSHPRSVAFFRRLMVLGAPCAGGEGVTR